MTRHPLAFVALASLLLLCCSGNGGFQDELSFGTGLDSTGMDLTGEATSFEVGDGLTLWFRLESEAAFDDRFVRLSLNDLEQEDFAVCAAAKVHVCLSQFRVSTPGTYEVKASLVDTGIGKETLVATQTLTLR